MEARQIKIRDYDYPLPDERIAKFPLPERDSSKLLVYEDGHISETLFRSLPSLLPEGALWLMEIIFSYSYKYNDNPLHHDAGSVAFS